MPSDRDIVVECLLDQLSQLEQLRADVTRFSELADKRHDELCEARRQRDSLAAKHVEFTRDAMTAAVNDFRKHVIQICKDKAAEHKRIADLRTKNMNDAGAAIEQARADTANDICSEIKKL